MKEVLQRLKKGVQTFQEEVYPSNAEGYRIAAQTQQKPHTLMITCADSRIDIETITHSQPGELFITRNVGNLVPAYGQMLGGVSAVIEYAVSALEVQHAVICGHSDCGAMKALQNPASLEKLPTVKSWLQNARAAVEVSASFSEKDELPVDSLRRLTEKNVLLQLQHLKTHPSVAGAMARGKLTVSAWVYDIATGDVRVAEDGQTAFEVIPSSSTGSKAAAARTETGA